MTSTVSSGPYVANSEVGYSDMSSNKRAKQSSTSTDASSGASAPKKQTASSSTKVKTSTSKPFKAAPARVHALESGVQRPPSLLEDERANEAMTELVLFPQWRYVVEPTCADSSEEPRSPTPPPQDVADEHQATARPTPHPDNATNTDQPQPRHPATEPGSSLFVAGLPSTVDDAALEILLSKFGRLICAKVALSPNTALSRGFAFVHYVTLAEADAARKALHGAAFPGHGGRLQIETSHRTPADHFQSATGSRVVMLRQVPTSCTVAEIQALASKHGEVVSCEMRSVPKGVEETSVTLRFRRSNDAAACVQTLHGKMPFHQCHLPFVARLVTAANTTTPKPLHTGQRNQGAANANATTPTTTTTTTKAASRNVRSPKPQLNHQDPSSMECHASTTAPNARRSSPSPGPAQVSQPQPPRQCQQQQPQPQSQQQRNGQQQASAAQLPPPFMWPGAYFPPPMPGASSGYPSMPQQPLLPPPGFAQHWGAGAPPMPPVWAAPQQAPGWPPSWAGTAPPPPLPPAMMGPASGGWYPPTA